MWRASCIGTVEVAYLLCTQVGAEAVLIQKDGHAPAAALYGVA